METIGQRLKYALDIRDKTKGGVAKKIGVHPSTIDNYLKSKVKNPSSVILEKTASYLDINPDWLILGLGDMDDKQEINNTILDFKNLSTNKKLDQIYSMLLELKKGQNILGEVIQNVIDSDNKKIAKWNLLNKTKKESLNKTLINFLEKINNA